MKSHDKRMSKRKLAERCAAIGAELYPDRQTAPDGTRVFLVKSRGTVTAYRSLKDVEKWLSTMH